PEERRREWCLGQPAPDGRATRIAELVLPARRPPRDLHGAPDDEALPLKTGEDPVDLTVADAADASEAPLELRQDDVPVARPLRQDRQDCAFQRHGRMLPPPRATRAARAACPLLCSHEERHVSIPLAEAGAPWRRAGCRVGRDDRYAARQQFVNVCMLP